ncbi:MAG: ABC transporter ATP-binding protein [Myxococcaceae bacterium]
MDRPSLQLVGVTKVLGGKRVLDNLSLEIPGGQYVVILGVSGTGKTVLLKHLIGLIRPDSGKVLVDGKDLWAISERERSLVRRRFGLAFQEGALFDSMSVFDNVAFALRRHTHKPPAEVAERVRTCLRLVRLSVVEGKRPAELSTGMRRRVGFARAIALEPEILLFDEPTAGLDIVTVTIINEVIRGLTERLNPTAVMVTHDLASARKLGDRIALLFGGKIIADAPVQRFFQLDHPAVRQLVEGRAEGPLTEPEMPPTQLAAGHP